MELKVLDPCCGSKMFWFDKNHDAVVYGDIRSEHHVLPDRALIIDPDIQMDFRNIPFAEETFYFVVFDPPHLIRAGKKSWLNLKYGTLKNDWREDLKQGFAECFRVLKTNSILVFKWNETQIKVNEILQLTDQKPLVGHISGKRADTHWISFMKGL